MNEQNRIQEIEDMLSNEHIRQYEMLHGHEPDIIVINATRFRLNMMANIFYRQELIEKHLGLPVGNILGYMLV